MNYSEFDDFYSQDKDNFYLNQRKYFILKHKPIINKLEKLQNIYDNLNVLNVFDAKYLISISKEIDRIKNHLQFKASFLEPFDC